MMFDPAKATKPVEIPFTEDGATFAGFLIRAVPASVYDGILEDIAESKKHGETIKIDDIAVDLIAEALTATYSSETTEPDQLSIEVDPNTGRAVGDRRDAAEQFWDQYPDWARSVLFEAVRDYSRRNPADPKAPKPSETGGE